MTTRVQAVRQRLGLTQSDMAEVLGLGLRAYQEIEAGRSKERPAHWRAAEHYALEWAVAAGDPAAVDPRTLELARKLTLIADH